MIFMTLKKEMDKLLKKTEEIDEDLVTAEHGIDKLRQNKEAHTMKTKKLEFYLRAKKLQREIDDVML